MRSIDSQSCRERKLMKMRVFYKTESIYFLTRKIRLERKLMRQERKQKIFFQLVKEIRIIRKENDKFKNERDKKKRRRR